jgi:5,10-methylenetetrahydromethanopterin reductase
MKIGLMAGAINSEGNTLADLIAQVQAAEADGFASFWLANIRNHDAIMAMAFGGHGTSRIEVGTAVTPTYPRHPTAIAQQALTAAAATSGRFTLGIGLSHKVVIEDALGFSYDKPARHMREYLSVLGPLLNGKPAIHKGDIFNTAWGLEVPDAPKPVPLLVAALGPVMLKLAGTLADGTITWMTGPRTLGQHIKPGLDNAAAEVGRPGPRVVAGFPVALTQDIDGTKDLINSNFEIYGQLPSYRAMLDREGAAGPADIALVGNEKELSQGVARLKDAGVTDFIAVIADGGDGDEGLARTNEFLKNQL